MAIHDQKHSDRREMIEGGNKCMNTFMRTKEGAFIGNPNMLLFSIL